jgi:hypothetical protein|tara:strand:- start:7 stop:237 length:231 start_codon:yes stop_codon:yes gene_type:complete
MNTSLLINAGLISAFFLIFKFIEMRLITKDNIPPKVLVRDASLVFIGTIAAHYLLMQFGSAKTKGIVEVFTDNPSF